MAKKKDKNIDQFKQGIFSLRTNFGELAQLMLSTHASKRHGAASVR